MSRVGVRTPQLFGEGQSHRQACVSFEGCVAIRRHALSGPRRKERSSTWDRSQRNGAPGGTAASRQHLLTPRASVLPSVGHYRHSARLSEVRNRSHTALRLGRLCRLSLTQGRFHGKSDSSAHLDKAEPCHERQFHDSIYAHMSQRAGAMAPSVRGGAGLGPVTASSCR